VANHQNGGRSTVPDENRASWRPQDQSSSSTSARGRGNEDDHDYRSWRERSYRDDDRRVSDRDPRRWEGSRGSELGYSHELDRSTERYGQGQSGYTAGRHGDDRSMQMQMQNRNELAPPGSEDRYYDLGTDERFSGRGASSWTDRSDRGGYPLERYGAQGGYGGGRRFEAERMEPRGYDQRGYDQRGYDQRGYDPRMGRMGGYDQRMGYQGEFRQGYQHMGYQAGPMGDPGYGMPQDARRSGATAHVHGNTGPHRGKGPLGYQRSDERIRELVCEALADDDQIDASQVHVSVKDGEVTLSGTVDNRRIKREAEDCVSMVSGVRDVQIQLRIKNEQPGDQRSEMSGQPGTGTSSVGPSGMSPSSGSNAGSAGATRDSHASGSVAGKTEAEGTSQDKKNRA
jgi:osmotically-inducible protein OsmY